MRLAPSALVAVAALGCATHPARPPEAVPAPTHGEVLRAAELARLRCVVVAPFENGSDVPQAADAATASAVAAIDPARARAFPVGELRALFRDTAFELPEGIGPSLAHELGQLLGADGVLYGSVEGRSAAGSPFLVSIRIAVTGDRDLLFAQTIDVHPRQGEAVDAAVRRAVAEASRPFTSRLGAPGKKACFDRERQARLRAVALADARAQSAHPPARLDPAATSAAQAAPAPATPAASGPATPATAAASSAPPAAAGAAATAAAAPAAKPAKSAKAGRSAKSPAPPRPRQVEWAKRLAAGGRFVVEDVSYRQRTATLAGGDGLPDLAAALALSPTVKLRIEAFVDATSDAAGDAKLSGAMAQAAGQRLVQLGVARDRVSWVGRGGESPLVPNFTARGRAANRRIEATGLK